MVAEKYLQKNLTRLSGQGLAFGAEAVASGVKDPRVVVGALHASEQSQGLSGQLPGGQGAGVGQ